MKIHLAVLPIYGVSEEDTAIFVQSQSGEYYMLITEYLLEALDVTLPEISHLKLYRCTGSQNLFLDRESLLLAASIKWATNPTSRIIFTCFKDTDGFSYPVQNANRYRWASTFNSREFNLLSKPTTRKRPIPLVLNLYDYV